MVRCIKQEDIVSNSTNPDKFIASDHWPRKTGRLARLREVLQWYWYIWILPISRRLIAILLAIASVLVVLGESTLFLDAPVGLVPLFFDDTHEYIVTESFCFVCLMYFIYCTFIALFRLKLKGRYGLYKGNHTDPPNLLWSAFIMARMTPPLCYNFILFIKVSGTQFERVLGVVDIVPIFGKDFTVFFPMVLFPFVLMNLFNVYSRLMAKIGIPQFGFSDELDDDDKIHDGKRIVGKYRGRGPSSLIVPEREHVQPQNNFVQTERTISMQRPQGSNLSALRNALI